MDIKIKKLKSSLIVGFSVVLFSCGGGGKSPVLPDDEMVSPAGDWSGLKKVLPYFMHKSKHDSLMLRFNMSTILFTGIDIGVEDSASCESGNKDENTSPLVVNGMLATSIVDVSYADCVSKKGTYQNGSINISIVTHLSDNYVISEVNVNDFVNTNFPVLVDDGRQNSLKNELRSIQVAVTGSKHDFLSRDNQTSTIDRVTFKTNKGDKLVVDQFDIELVTKKDRLIITKHNILAEWDMDNDASHNQMIRTASFLIWVDGVNRTFSPGHYKMEVKVLEDIVALTSDPGFPIAGSYQVDLDEQGISLVTEFNSSGAVVTHSKNGFATVSRISR